MITYKDLIDKVDFELVWKEYLVYYPDMFHRREEFYKVYKCLLSKEPQENIEGMIIHIDRQDYEEFSDDVDCRLELDDKGIENIVYRVHGKNNSAEWSGYWDMSSSKWREWLGYYIHDKVVDFFSIEQIVALCLYEMTWHGLTENEVINWVNSLDIDSEK